MRRRWLGPSPLSQIRPPPSRVPLPNTLSKTTSLTSLNSAENGSGEFNVAVTVTVADTAPLADDFAARGIAHVKDQERILLPAEDNFGLTIEVLPAVT